VRGDTDSAHARGRARWLRVTVGTAIAIAFVTGVQYFIGWSALLRPWRELPAVMIALPALLLLASHGLRALRVHDYFGQPVRGGRWACLQLVLRHNLFNNLLPMRSGELAFPVLMQRHFGVRMAVSVPGLLWFRLLDLHSIGLLALPVLAPVAPPGALAMVALAWLLLPWLFFRRGRWMMAAAVARAPARLRRVLETAMTVVPVEPGRFWSSWGWTLGTWAIKLAAFAWVLMLFAPLGPGTALFGAIGGELTSVLPVHGVAGLGTYEAGVVAALVPTGGEPTTLVRAAVNLHLFVLGVTLIAGALAWLPMANGARVRSAAKPETGEETRK
jgi:hypothetical protein